MACIALSYVAMAYRVMAYIVMASRVMAYIVMADAMPGGDDGEQVLRCVHTALFCVARRAGGRRWHGRLFVRVRMHAYWIPSSV